MSRGHGDVQRRTLAVLAAGTSPARSIDVAAAVFGRNPVTAAEAVSVRRALRTLTEQGLAVDLGRAFRWDRASPAKAAAYGVPADSSAFATFVSRTASAGGPSSASAGKAAIRPTANATVVGVRFARRVAFRGWTLADQSTGRAAAHSSSVRTPQPVAPLA